MRHRLRVDENRLRVDENWELVQRGCVALVGRQRELPRVRPGATMRDLVNMLDIILKLFETFLKLLETL